jgi:hypothetical protein
MRCRNSQNRQAAQNPRKMVSRSERKKLGPMGMIVALAGDGFGNKPEKSPDGAAGIRPVVGAGKKGG